jgi:plastocyanin
MTKSAVLILFLAFLAGCTPGGSFAASGGSAGGSVTTVDVNLTLHADGFSPDTVTVPVGSTIRFFNSDSFAHTATLIPGATSFPVNRPFDASATSQIPKNAPAILSQPWSSGALQPSTASQNISVDAPGTYLYGCYFHYSAPMRGTIIAQ